MTFSNPNRLLRAYAISWKILVVRSEKPSASVAVQNPMSPTSRQPDLGLKGPAVRTSVHHTGRIILTSWHDRREANADEAFFLPGGESAWRQRWAAFQVGSESNPAVSQTRAIHLSWRS